jgi:hypothetical protein
MNRAALEPVRVSLRLHWRLGLAVALLVPVVGALAAWATPRAYRVDAELLMSEPVAMHRLSTPFLAVPQQWEELEQLPELLMSRVRLVALIKRTNLLDAWSTSRPWPLQLKDQLQQALLGPVSDQDRLEVLLQMLERRVNVNVQGAHILIGVQWSDPRVALRIVESIIVSLQEQREARDVKALNEAASALDEQLLGLRVQLRSRMQRLDALWSTRRLVALVAETQQLDRDRERAAELLVLAEDKHISADVMHRANALRFIPLRPPRVPRTDLGPRPVQIALATLLAMALAGLVAVLGQGVLGGKVLSARQLGRSFSLPVLAALGPDDATAPPGPSWWGVAAALGLAMASGAALGISRGGVVLAAVPALAVVGLYVVWLLPTRYSLLGLMLLAVTLDDPGGRPYNGLWRSPLFPLGQVFFKNVAWFTGFELAVMGLGMMRLFKHWLRVREAGSPLLPPRVLRVAVWASFLTVVVMYATGILRGGGLRDALWQARVLLLIGPLMALTWSAFEFPRDLPALLKVLAAGSVVKALLAIYFIYVVIGTGGEQPPHTTGHHDTMIFVTAVVVSLLLIWERPTSRHLALALAWLPLLALAIKLNDRRVAYVDLAFSLLFVYTVSPWHLMKRRFARAVLVLAVPVALYMAAGWNARFGAVFAPVQVVRSLISPEENTKAGSSSVERDIENFDILKSWEENMLLGRGFGFHFTEYLPTFDFSQSGFGQVGHNSVLWLWWIGGPLGFTGVLGFLVVSFYLVRRCLAATRVWSERVALFAAMSILITYLTQGFGDMGFNSSEIAFFVAAAVAITGQYATRLNVLRPPTQVAVAGTTPIIQL